MVPGCPSSFLAILTLCLYAGKHLEPRQPAGPNSSCPSTPRADSGSPGMPNRRSLSMAFVPAVQPPKCFPCCIVWTPIPVVTWLLPFMGHMGVCTSAGRILDFAASFYVSADAMAFGNPTKSAHWPSPCLHADVRTGFHVSHAG